MVGFKFNKFLQWGNVAFFNETVFLKLDEPRNSGPSSTFSVSHLCWLIVVDVFFASLARKDSLDGLGHHVLVERQHDHDEAEMERDEIR